MSNPLVVLHVVGARPNLMKVAPVMRALASYEGVRQILLHTGQHYDTNLSEVFFEELQIPRPDVNLEVGSDSHARQTAEVMSRLEPVVVERAPNLVMVYGDVNSTLAGALVCAKLGIPVAHVEAGLRSFDRTMPEEINRLLTDQVADLLFTTSAEAEDNLCREGIAPQKIHFTGNVMIDTLLRLLPTALDRWGSLQSRLQIAERYGVITLHRPSNVDAPRTLETVVGALQDISRDVPLVFPVHPRTRQRLDEFALHARGSCLQMIDPLGYLDFLALERHATLVITDSGGIQEETTFLGVPCLTLRKNTERPVTVSLGTNLLVGQDLERLRVEVKRIVVGDKKSGQVPPLWDGRAAERIAKIVATWRSGA